VSVDESWLEIPTGDGWVAAYRLAHSGPARARETHILELRVFPDDGGPRPPGEWRGIWQGADVERPRKAFLFSTVHRLVKERVFDTTLAAIHSNLAGQDDGERKGVTAAVGAPSRGHAGSSHEGQGAARKRRPDVFYAHVAVEYHRIEHNPRREPGESSHRILARRRSVPETTIVKWLSTARSRGLLTRTRAGRRGSMARDSAVRLVKNSDRIA
jgi:hypothetical protein